MSLANGDAPEPQPEPLGRGSLRRDSGLCDSQGNLFAQARARHDACVDHLRTLAERVDDLEAENSHLRSSEERLRVQNQELLRQVHQLRVERQRPIERLRSVIDECVRDREVRRAPEQRQEAQQEHRQLHVRIGPARRGAPACSSVEPRACRAHRDGSRGSQPRQLQITHKLGTVRRGGA